uniref:Reverse transcriptase domain-containing protein n=1 Tax=Eutreptiella gymnastica TaxID=73025 RepID=A0A7S1I8F4_9EUGL
MLEAFLAHAGLPKQWVAVILSFLKGPIGFLVGRRVSAEWMYPGGGIRQGDTLSPALFALITALLCRKLEQKMPGVKTFLYADDSLLWVEGNPQEVSRTVAELKEIMREYGNYTGQRLNLSKCSAILQGDWGQVPISHIEGIQVEKYVRYLGWHLGEMAP